MQQNKLKTKLMNIVICTNLDTGATKLVTMQEAIKSLSGYWKVEKIEETLIKGITLHTPFETYKIKQDDKS